MTKASDIGAVLMRLETTIAARKGASAETSYTAKLLAGGPHLAAKKLGEEAVETVLAGAGEGSADLAREAGDLLYHLLVLLAARDVSLQTVADVLAAREGVSGLEEKARR